MNEKEVTSIPAEFARKLERERDEWKAKYIQQNKDLGCEMMDPNGTIWDYAKNLQKEQEEHEENYVQMLKHCNHVITERDELLKERDELLKERDELRNKLLEIEEIAYNDEL